MKARTVLLAGTSEEGVRPSALIEAERLLRPVASLGPQDADARALALLGHVSLLRGDAMYGPRFLHMARRVGPDDPWVAYYWGEHESVQGGEAMAMEHFVRAVEQGLSSRRELRRALAQVQPFYARSRMRDKADAAFARQVALDPRDAKLRSTYARHLIAYFVDFEAAERLARDALALGDDAAARQMLSLAMYGGWAQAARDGKPGGIVQALYRKAHDNDPGARHVPSCMAAWEPVRFVYERLEAMQVRREQMHQC